MLSLCACCVVLSSFLYFVLQVIIIAVCVSVGFLLCLGVAIGLYRRNTFLQSQHTAFKKNAVEVPFCSCF